MVGVVSKELSLGWRNSNWKDMKGKGGCHCRRRLVLLVTCSWRSDTCLSLLPPPGPGVAAARLQIDEQHAGAGRATPASGTATKLRFSPPVLLGSGVNLTLSNGTNITLHSNETNLGFFYALDDLNIFGQYGEAEVQLSHYDPFVRSSDGGATWHSAGQERNCDLNHPPYMSVCFQNALVPVRLSGGSPGRRRFFSLSGNGPQWSGPSAVGPAPFTSFSSTWRSTYENGPHGVLNASLVRESVVFKGIPPSRAVWPLCSTAGLMERSIFTYAVTELAGGQAVAAVLMCDSPSVKQAWKTNLSAPSLVAFVSDPGSEGQVWSWAGVIADAREMVPTQTVRGLTAEADMTLLADGKTLMAVMRVDGDCTCSMARAGPGQQPECGLYRNYYQSFSSDQAKTWSRPQPMPGMGCVRPHLLSLGSRGVVVSGGRLCVENTSGLFLWFSQDGMAGQGPPVPAHDTHAAGAGWERFSVSYWHNRMWQGSPAYRFDELINASDVFETQSYTGLVRVGEGDFLVLYNKYWPPLSDGMAGCNANGAANALGCSTAFAMRVSIEPGE